MAAGEGEAHGVQARRAHPRSRDTPKTHRGRSQYLQQGGTRFEGNTKVIPHGPNKDLKKAPLVPASQAATSQAAFSSKRKTQILISRDLQILETHSHELRNKPRMKQAVRGREGSCSISSTLRGCPHPAGHIARRRREPWGAPLLVPDSFSPHKHSRVQRVISTLT